MSIVLSSYRKKNKNKNNENNENNQEDELDETEIKYNQIIDMLLAAGYFRARIQGLSQLDKIIGGMAWCLTYANIDVDSKVVFHQEAKIGEKIKLGEEIEKALKQMRCPFPLQSFQISGLDTEAIFPVIQWLVRQVLEIREETGDIIKQFSIHQFHNNYSLPSDTNFDQSFPKSQIHFSSTQSRYKPQRKFRRILKSNPSPEMRIQSTLLEYGSHFKTIAKNEKTKQEHSKSSDFAKKLVAMQTSKETINENEKQQKEVQEMMNKLSEIESDTNKISAKTLGNIVGIRSQEIYQLSSEYTKETENLGIFDKKQQELLQEAHERKVSKMNEQIEKIKEKALSVKKNREEAQEKLDSMKEQFEKRVQYKDRIISEIQRFEKIEQNEEVAKIIRILQQLLSLTENLKKQEEEFKNHCRKERDRINEMIESFGNVEEVDTNSREKTINDNYSQELSKNQQLRQSLGEILRNIAILQRKIESVPTRAELIQYEKRFVELYQQMNTKVYETKKHFNTYNSLEDEKAILEKELAFLNKINAGFQPSMKTENTKQQFIQSFEQIIDGVSRNAQQVHKVLEEEQTKFDLLSKQFQELSKKQRKYVAKIHEFQKACSLNEQLAKEIEEIKQSKKN
ncbi:coiled-coil domain-containing protein [Anaeramoeba ignava]|uniref:Coiled-coil domain-containing protein n=1 Tax=Anaeramoeba ignava TaxID=1746090 RepID=A0A9Q0L9C8_ANAIG|nr:coiled-coil domain-containing protein [Anaeramoeba ignava]KAJ5077598.1 coiled-coil domain-containing protein [Anaeramoeba ignava]